MVILLIKILVKVFKNVQALFQKKLNLFREPKSLEIEINDRSNRIPVFRNTFL